MDPWNLVSTSVRQQCDAKRADEALAYVEQSRDFYRAAVAASVSAARPLLLYYCFMNLVKAYCVTKDPGISFSMAKHGLQECLVPGGKEFLDAYLVVHAGVSNTNVFDAFCQVLTGINLPNTMRLDLVRLLPQVVPGHRLWAEAANEQERFINLLDIQFRHRRSTQTMWLSLDLFADDLSRLGVSHRRLLEESGLGGDFREVIGRHSKGKRERRHIMHLESVRCPRYGGQPSDAVHLLVPVIKHRLWTTVASVPPYRRYYLYLAPPADRGQVIPQLLSIYAIMFYLGSITRYRPHHFDRILNEAYGARILEFIDGQPLEFMYLMASEFAGREVTKPSIV